MQTYTNNITINYNGETISLPVIHNGVDHQGINELKEYLQGILDQFPEDFLKTYHPVSHQVFLRSYGYTVHITTFNWIDPYKLDPLQEIYKDQIIELIYKPEFSGPIFPKIIHAYDSVIIINHRR